MRRFISVLLAAGCLFSTAVRAATLFGLTNDCEVQITLTNPPYAIASLTSGTLLVGTSGAVGKERCAVIPFQLPSLGAVTNPFLTAAFTFDYPGKTGTVLGNLDVQGLGRRASATVLTNDFWTATNAVDPTDATLLEDGIITANSTAYGLKTSSFAGSAALTAYLNAQYAGGAGAGQFVFLRLGTDAAQTGGNNRYLITSAEGAMATTNTTIWPQINYLVDPGPIPPPAVSIIASDNFDKYTSGALAGQGSSGFGWAGGWVAGAASTVTMNSDATVIYAVPDGGGLIGGGRSVEIAGSGTGIPATRTLTTPQTNTFYAGFLIDVSGNPNTGDTYALYLNNSATDTTNGVNAGLRGDPANGAYFFLGKGITAPGSGTLASGSGTITDTRYLVLKIEKTAAGNFNKTTAWINPATNSETAKPNGNMQLIQDLGVGTISQVLLRASGVDAGDSCNIDSVTLAKNFSDLMTPARPGPDSRPFVAQIRVEAVANGSANVSVPTQTLAPGTWITNYAIARAGDGSFLSNTPAIWQLTNVSGAILNQDLVVSADGKSAVFKANGAGFAQILAVGNATNLWPSGGITVTPRTNANAIGRPFIWTRMAERDSILARIDNTGVAAAQFLLLKNRADAAAASHTANRDSYIRQLPLVTTNGTPKYRQDITAATDTTLVQRYNAGVDCAAMYYLTGDEKYARCGADILHNAVLGYLNVTPFADVGNGGWIYADGLLGEASASGMQLPVIYDYLYDYLKASNTVYQLQTTGGTNVAFSFTNAQEVFRTFYELTRDHGQANNNWSANMAQTLVPCALALDDPAERTESLKDYLTRDNARQTSLKTDATKYPNPGDIWPESLDYSEAVNTIHPYLMVMLDRYDPTLNLFTNYPNVALSMARPFQLVYPNGKQIHFGDFHHDDDPQPYFQYEAVYRHAAVRDLPDLRELYGPLINAGIAANTYDRAGLIKDNALPLFWFADAVSEPASASQLPRADTLSHAGVALQRNPSTVNNTLNGLMCFVGGGAHVHSHANGMNMELYGQGLVLGAEGGRGDYGSALHENYYRLFAAHNTIIVNGQSRGEGGWSGLAISTVQVVGMEPAAFQPAVSSNLSFTCTSFADNNGTNTEATQQRTLAIVRTSPTNGYYVDFYRSKSTVTNRVATTLTGNVTNQFHDYIYHNLGNSLDIDTNGAALPLLAQATRFQNDIGDAYDQPGWRYFSNTVVSLAHSQPVRAQYNYGGIYMDLHLPAVTNREYATADAPGIIIPPANGTLPAPVLAVRQIGDAWNRPFAVVFEPHKGAATSGSVTNVAALEKNGIVVGLKVESRVGGSNLVQYVLSNPNATDTYTNIFGTNALAFTGRFAVVTDRGNGAVTLYVGDGSSLFYQGNRVVAHNGSNTQANVQFAAGLAPVVTANAPVDVTRAGQPFLSAIADQTVNQNTATAALPFTVDDDLTPPAALVVTAISSNTNLVPNANIALGGSNANRTITVTPAPGQTGTTTIQLVVSDGSLTATNAFALTVLVDSLADLDGDGMTDVNELLLGRNPASAADLAFEFNADGIFDGWGTFAGITNSAVTNGAMTGVTTSGDPHFQRSGFNFAGDSVSNVIVRLRLTTNSNVQLFWGRVGSTGFAAGKSVTATYTVPNNWQTLILPLATNTEWQGQTITSLRIDPGASSNQTFEIDWVRAANGNIFAPTLATISNRTINAGQTVTIMNVATDADLPAQVLTFNLLTNPLGATVNSNTGVFTWRPTVALAPTTNPIILKVADNGSPSLSATQQFTVFVNPLVGPSVTSLTLSNGQSRLLITGDLGPDYTVQATTNFTNWTNLLVTNSPTLPLNWTDTNAGSFLKRFYRVLLGP